METISKNGGTGTGSRVNNENRRRDDNDDSNKAWEDMSNHRRVWGQGADTANGCMEGNFKNGWKSLLDDEKAALVMRIEGVTVSPQKLTETWDKLVKTFGTMGEIRLVSMRNIPAEKANEIVQWYEAENELRVLMKTVDGKFKSLKLLGHEQKDEQQAVDVLLIVEQPGNQTLTVQKKKVTCQIEVPEKNICAVLEVTTPWDAKLRYMPTTEIGCIGQNPGMPESNQIVVYGEMIEKMVEVAPRAIRLELSKALSQVRLRGQTSDGKGWVIFLQTDDGKTDDKKQLFI